MLAQDKYHIFLLSSEEAQQKSNQLTVQEFSLIEEDVTLEKRRTKKKTYKVKTIKIKKSNSNVEDETMQ